MLIPKYTIEIKLNPPEGGQVKGTGSYAEGKEVQIEAYLFDLNSDADLAIQDSSGKIIKESKKSKNIPEVIELFDLPSPGYYTFKISLYVKNNSTSYKLKIYGHK